MGGPKRKFYYRIKPYIPRQVQLLLRRQRALWMRSRYADTWPVAQKAGRSPHGWPGWPEQKRFAFILTHDVETAGGHAKCRDLVHLEERLGFRSSFNFVPEKYEVSPELRHFLEGKGFEVGVHGLCHDGKYFNSRELFSKRAVQINRYMKEWGAAGFRSPSMLHALDWLHELELEYDSSTFDTDPFEPQPDGMNTIFPFFVPGPPLNGGDSLNGGYMELPYTLPQDFRLYIIMRENNIDIWKKKLDWIAEHGGMALLNTHPDYMNFGGNKRRAEEYPAAFYREFLHYVKSRYEGRFWHALPRDVARWGKKEIGKTSAASPSFPSGGLSASKDIPACKNGNAAGAGGPRLDFQRHGAVSGGKGRAYGLKACMVAYSFYETDARIMRYAESLAARGDQVDVFSLARNGAAPVEKINGVTVHRIQRRDINEKTKFSYLGKMMSFLLRSSWQITKRSAGRPYDIVHVHSVPDFEVFAAFFTKLRGSKVILDVHDIVPEFYGSKFGVSRESFAFKALQLAERWSAAFSDHVIIANHIWEKVITSRSVPSGKCSTFLNYPDSRIFNCSKRTRQDDGRFIMMYPGTLNWHQGLDIAIKAFGLIKPEAPEAEFHIYGKGPARDSLKELVEERSLQDRVKIMDVVPVEEVAGLMANADLGIVPKRNDSFGGDAFSTKIFEFMALGVPVVAANTRIDTFYFNDSLLKFFQAGDEKSLADALLEMIKGPGLRRELATNALAYIAGQSWDVKRKDYLDLVDRLVKGNA